MFPLIETTISAIQSAFETGQLTEEELLLGYLERLARHDRSGVTLNSVLELNPDARGIALALQARRRTGGLVGPLHGIPILLKDNINTGDRTHTSAGSLALADNYARTDARLVAQLRAAGAVILGKANMTEWANWMARRMPGGYSARGGQVLNPYGPTHPAGGSSTGSGVAVSANLCAVAIGTETSGSILSPAISNMVVGIKPTVGLVSRAGIIPISYTQDTAGPLTRTVEDGARVLAVLAGVDPADPVTGCQIGRVPKDYAGSLRGDALAGARIGVPRGGFWADLGSEEKRLAEKAIESVRDLGAHIIDPAEVTTASELLGRRQLFRYEFKSAVGAYLMSLNAAVPVKSLKDVIAFNRAHAGAELRYGQSRLLDSQLRSGKLTEPEYLDALADNIRLFRTDGIDATLDRDRLDALLFPGLEGSDLAARAGYPSVAVPAGFGANGRPFGITFCGTAFSEAILLGLAYSFEQATHARLPPELG